MAVAALVDAGVPADGRHAAPSRRWACAGLRVAVRAAQARRLRRARASSSTWPGQSSGATHDARARARSRARTRSRARPRARPRPRPRPRARARPPRLRRDQAAARRARGSTPTRARWPATSSRASPTSRRSCTARASTASTFHEVGAFDSIADVVGVAAAIAWLAPASIGSLPPVVGTGRVRTAHGAVPGARARDRGAAARAIPIVAGGRGRADDADRAPRSWPRSSTASGRCRRCASRAVGYGAGHARARRSRRTCCASCVGEPLGAADAPAAPEVTLLEANIDDMSPQLVAPLVEALLGGRRGRRLVDADRDEEGAPGAAGLGAGAARRGRRRCERAFFRNSTTLGVRRTPLERVVLARSFARSTTRVRPGAREARRARRRGAGRAARVRGLPPAGRARRASPCARCWPPPPPPRARSRAPRVAADARGRERS